MRKSQKKDVNYSVSFDFGQSVAISGFAIDPKGRPVAIGPNGQHIRPKTATVASHFERANPAKPKKIVSSVFLDHQTPHWNVDAALLSQYYDWLFIDTNTRSVNNTPISVTAVVRAVIAGAAISGKPRVDLLTEVCIEFRSADASPEQIGWGLVFKGYDKKLLAGIPSSIVLITDHALDDLAKFNRREKKVADRLYVPYEYQLAYSSGERGKGFGNVGVNMADWMSNALLDEICKNPNNASGVIMAKRSDPFYSYRVWRSPFLVPHEFKGSAGRSFSRPKIVL